MIGTIVFYGSCNVGKILYFCQLEIYNLINSFFTGVFNEHRKKIKSSYYIQVIIFKYYIQVKLWSIQSFPLWQLLMLASLNVFASWKPNLNRVIFILGCVIVIEKKRKKRSSNHVGLQSIQSFCSCQLKKKAIL